MPTQSLPSLRDLMAAGAHFGHKRERSHPKAKSYIYVLREGIYIIDLQKTQEGLEKALAAVSEMAKHGKTILFVGTKPQAADLVKAAALKAGMPYMTHRWPGGLLTNFDTVRENLKQLEDMEAQLEADQGATLTKKERRVIDEKYRKANNTLGGIRGLKQLPEAMFVVDIVAEATAVNEAYRLGIPIIAICDTNANPERIDYPIPANDDARKAIELIVNLVSEAIAGSKTAPAAPAAAAEEPVETPAETAQAEVEAPAEPVAVEEPAAKAEKAEAPAKPKRARAKKAKPEEKGAK